MKVVGASVVTTSGCLATVGGLGCVAAGTALTASRVLAPVRIPLITAGAYIMSLVLLKLGSLICVSPTKLSFVDSIIHFMLSSQIKD